MNGGVLGIHTCTRLATVAARARYLLDWAVTAALNTEDGTRNDTK